jgi:hypothetical protein
VEDLTGLRKYVYAYERNEFTDPASIGLFDKLDCIVMDVDHRLQPWGDRTRALLLLVKTAFFTNKPVFAAGAGIQFVAFVLGNGGKRVRVLNGAEGSDANDAKLGLQGFQTPAEVGPDDVFLDSASGDFFSLGRAADGTAQWTPAGTVGSHLHDGCANIQTPKYGVRPPSPRKKQYGGPVHRAVPVTHYPVKAMMRGEVKVRVVKRHLRHAAFR